MREYYFKVPPLRLIEPYSSFQLAFEYKWSKSHSFQVAAGYVYLPFYADKIIFQEGFRVEAEKRFYMKGPDVDLYLAPHFSYFAARREAEELMGRDCDGWDCNYFEDVRFNIRREFTGAHLKCGFQWVAEDLFVLDVYVGPGAKYLIYKVSGIPEDASRHWENGPPREISLIRKTSFERWTPSVLAGFKLGIVLGK